MCTELKKQADISGNYIIAKDRINTLILRERGDEVESVYCTMYIEI